LSILKLFLISCDIFRINTYNSRNKAIWNVSRIQGNELLPIIPPTTTTYQPSTTETTPLDVISTTTDDYFTTDGTEETTESNTGYF